MCVCTCVSVGDTQIIHIHSNCFGDEGLSLKKKVFSLVGYLNGLIGSRGCSVRTIIMTVTVGCCVVLVSFTTFVFNGKFHKVERKVSFLQAPEGQEEESNNRNIKIRNNSFSLVNPSWIRIKATIMMVIYERLRIPYPSCSTIFKHELPLPLPTHIGFGNTDDITDL